MDPLQAVFYLRDRFDRECGDVFTHPALREAACFAFALREMPIADPASSLLAGEYGPDVADSAFQADLAAWQSRGNGAPSTSVRRDPAGWFKAFAPQVESCHAAFTATHTTVDFASLVTMGLPAYLNRCASFHSADADEESVRSAMVQTLHALRDWLLRFGRLSDRPGPRACAALAERAPESFLEAVQLVWLVNTAIGISERNTASLSMGRFDQYLHPFYERDRRRGVSEAALGHVLRDLFGKLNRYGDAACAINLGGIDENGRDGWNDLTRHIVRIAAELAQPAPLLAARIHPDMRESDFALLLSPTLASIGQPSFYGERACRAALARRGVGPEDARRWVANSCMGLMIGGKEFSDMWGVVLSLLVPFEHVFGTRRMDDLPVALPEPPGAFDTIDHLLDATLTCAEPLLAHLIAQHRASTDAQPPNPYLSALLADCAQRGRDRLRGGARYHTVNVDLFGLVNLADSLTAIDRVVFQSNTCSLDALRDACRYDFADHPELLALLRHQPKFGSGDRDADAMVRRIADRMAAMIRRHNTGAMIYMPSFHTLNLHIHAGRSHAATPDGRRAGAPLAKNIGPMPGHARQGLTGLLASAASVGQEAYCGGQGLDISFPASDFATVAGRRAFMAAAQTYFAQGGLEIQINALNPDELRDAMAHPEAHQDLIVRIAGYSIRFTHLHRTVQEEMAERFANGV